MLVKEINPVRNAFEKETGIKLGKSLYQGDGEVFAIKGQKDRLVKVVWADSLDQADRRFKMLQYLKKANNGAVVKLHKVGRFGVDHIHPVTKTFIYTEHYYYYVMDKLKLGLGIREVLQIESALSTGDIPLKASGRVRSFVKKARQLKYSYTDFHEWNILKSKRGAYKFIDLESFSL